MKLPSEKPIRYVDPLRFDPRHLDSYVHIRLLDEMYSGRTLARVLARRLLRRVREPRSAIAPVVSYNGTIVFDRPDLHGGGLSWGQDFPRVLLRLGIGRCPTMFEFCSGPGYIGFLLMALGWCETLVLADVNPAATGAAELTSRYNGLGEKVRVYQSDVLDDIPETERWDLVVSNPPHFSSPSNPDDDLRAIDPDWNVHSRFYASVKKFMRPGGRVVMMENAYGSSTELFEPMIRAGGGRVVATLPGSRLDGSADGLYYLMSEW